MPAEVDRARQTKTILIGPFPPPAHGMARVLEAVRNELSDVECLDTAAGSIRPGSRSFAWTKLRNCLGAIVGLATASRSAQRVVIAPDSGEGMLFSLLYVALARSRGLDIFVQHHTSSYLDGSSLMMRMMCRIGGRKLRHVMLCASASETFRRHHRVDVAPLIIGNAYAVDSPPVRRTTFDRGGVVIGYLGNLSAAKGIEDFAALVSIARDQPGWSFRLGGPSVDAIADRTVRRLAADERVEIVGELDRHEVAEFLADLDVFVMPSRQEAMPLVIWESLREGTPVVARSIGCIPTMGRPDAVALVDADEQFADAARSVIAAWSEEGGEANDHRRCSARAIFTEAAARDRAALLAALR
ncbi:MAG: glycosyltransferase family 4 protein [Acidimicrobiales bacterium]